MAARVSSSVGPTNHDGNLSIDAEISRFSDSAKARSSAANGSRLISAGNIGSTGRSVFNTMPITGSGQLLGRTFSDAGKSVVSPQISAHSVLEYCNPRTRITWVLPAGSQSLQVGTRLSPASHSLGTCSSGAGGVVGLRTGPGHEFVQRVPSYVATGTIIPLAFRTPTMKLSAATCPAANELEKATRHPIAQIRSEKRVGTVRV